jgi:hypothetical protein
MASFARRASVLAVAAALFLALTLPAWAYVSVVYLNTNSTNGQKFFAETCCTATRLFNEASGAIGSPSCVFYRVGSNVYQVCGSGYLYQGYRANASAGCNLTSSGGQIQCDTTRP